jgi:hypothetical protein
MPNKRVPKKPIPGKPQATKPAQKNGVQKKPASDKLKDLRLLKETLRASSVQNKPAPDKVENLAIDYLAELKEGDVNSKREQPSSRNIAPNIRNSPATYERSFLESAA